MKRFGKLAKLDKKDFTSVEQHSFGSETWSLTALAKHLLNTKTSIAGPQYFKYNGEWLNALRTRLEGRG